MATLIAACAIMLTRLEIGRYASSLLLPYTLPTTKAINLVGVIITKLAELNENKSKKDNHIGQRCFYPDTPTLTTFVLISLTTCLIALLKRKLNRLNEREINALGRNIFFLH